jgi:hypothetical protein
MAIFPHQKVLPDFGRMAGIATPIILCSFLHGYAANGQYPSKIVSRVSSSGFLFSIFSKNSGLCAD